MLKRLQNSSTIIIIALETLLIARNYGLKVDNEAVMISVKAACAIDIIFEVLNNPTTAGLDLPFVGKKQ